MIDELHIFDRRYKSVGNDDLVNRFENVEIWKLRGNKDVKYLQIQRKTSKNRKFEKFKKIHEYKKHSKV